MKLSHRQILMRGLFVLASTGSRRIAECVGTDTDNFAAVYHGHP